ncbi:hypothetical protein BZL30_0312 [Mycobacterium kansasii]|uniref:Uncharacterized protein n=1 Tax=Mycobacterium kansasii TaxID=1768 RepID=A0A1V3XR87_MYCKA|nr:hypothetical protein BZL30_0312 [Mycobacterium kansasii]
MWCSTVIGEGPGSLLSAALLTGGADRRSLCCPRRILGREARREMTAP